jgi:hypothetical protein
MKTMTIVSVILVAIGVDQPVPLIRQVFKYLRMTPLVAISRVRIHATAHVPDQTRPLL